MKIKSMEQIVQDFLNCADVKINGKRPWDIQVNNQNLYLRILLGGSIALGEAYMDGWWGCKALDQLADRLLRARLDIKIRFSKYLAWNTIKARIMNQQRRSKAYVIGERHYDTGNDLYKNMLDKRLNYSCG
ncbi:MAG: cyclopropane-fatty-acyl-phospholipid synthase, partial [Candidatus Caldatribacteriota bacterium]|nr:cyclopropane-fatty-acyl-phospholipid synthase [Candidatus Caldatribacteriota bacterium]